MGKVTLVTPIKVKDFNGSHYYLVVEDANKVTHFFHKEHTATIDGVKKTFEQGEYDGWEVEAPCCGVS